MAQHCIHCGSAHRAAAKVCPTCGRAVEADDDATRAVPTSTPPEVERPDSPEAGRGPGALIPPPPPPPADDDTPPAAVPPSIALPGRASGAAPAGHTHRAEPTVADRVVEPTAPVPSYSSGRPNPLVIIAGLLVVLGAGIGAYVLSGDDDSTTEGSTPTSEPGGATSNGGIGPGDVPTTLVPVSVTATAERQILRNETCTGADIPYTVDLLIDGDEQTGWGAGEDDGTGESATLDFGEPVRITTLAMTPGYTKVGPRRDNECQDTPAFPNNRWVTSVEYRFDDGTTLVQDFVAQPTLQSIDADVVTRTLTVTILGTARPPGADDDTIISELRVAGTPAG